MRILQLCNKIPFPPKDGGSLAMNALTQGLISYGHELYVLAINTPKHYVKEEDIDPEYKRKTNYRSVFIDTNVKIFPALLNLFSTESYNISRFYSKEFENTLIKILSDKEFDIIQLESIFVAPYLNCIRKHSKAKVVLRSHNVEYAIWKGLAKASRNPMKRSYLNLLSSRLKKYELSVMNKFDGIAFITNSDAEIYKKAGCKLPSVIIPFGIDLKKYTMDLSKAEFPSVFHIGAMDWIPNAEGIKWVLENVWKIAQERLPGLKLYLAGRNMPLELKEWKQQNVVVLGEVEDASAFISSKSIMIVPLHSGSGMRVKIIEGMALGKVVVSTTLGAEGIACLNHHDILIADTEKEFADAIYKCANNKMFTEEIGRNARRLVEEKYDVTVICQKLSVFFKEL